MFAGMGWGRVGESRDWGGDGAKITMRGGNGDDF